MSGATPSHLIGLAIVASQPGPNVIDLQATLELQRLTFPPFATLMFWVSWPGYFPQSLALPIVVAAVFLVRGYRIEAIWVLGTSMSSIATTLLKDLVHRPRLAPDLVGVATPFERLELSERPHHPVHDVIRVCVLPRVCPLATIVRSNHVLVVLASPVRLEAAL
jgi:hypothetical protein